MPPRIPFFNKAVPASPPGDVVYGFYLSNGSIAPIGMKSSGAFGQAVQSQVRARRELQADDAGLALAYAAAPTANRCVDLRATKVASMPHSVYSKRDKTPIDDHPLMQAFRASRRMWGKDVLYVWEHSLCLHGETYFEKATDVMGRPAALRWLNPIATEPQIQQGKIVSFDYAGDDAYISLPPSIVVYDYLHNPLSEWRGLSLMQTALTAANIHINYLEYIQSFFRNDATPGGILAARQNTTINKADSERLLKFFSDQLQGARNKFKTIFMPAPLEYQRVQQPPAPEFVETERSAKRTICEVFGVPISLVDFDNERFQLSEEQPKLLYENTIIPECERISKMINDNVLPWLDDSGDVEFGFDYDQIRAMLDDQVKRATAINARLLAGNLTVNEARVKFGDKPVDGGDIFYTPRAQQPIRLEDLPRIEEIMEENQSRPDAQNAPKERVLPHQNDPTGELRAWQKKAMGSLRRGRQFTPYVLPASVAAQIKAELLALPDDVDKNAIKAVFVQAQRDLKSLLELDDLDGLVRRLLDSGLEQTLQVA